MTTDAPPRRQLLTCVDARGYGGSDDLRQEEIQAALAGLLDTAAARAGLNRSTWDRQPSGDGELAVLPDSEPEPRLVDDYVREINSGLRRLNRNLRDEVRLRLRVAIHHGMVKPAAMGFSGQGVVEVARLADAAQAKRALTTSGADLVLIVSDRVYRDTVRQPHTSIPAGRFRPVTVTNKELVQPAWLYLPDGDIHAVTLDDAAPVQPAPADGDGGGSGGGGGGPTVIGQTVIGGIAGRDITVTGWSPSAARRETRHG